MAITHPSERLQSSLGHHFSDDSLLTVAVTHTSYAAEHDGASSYERLEFLGDAVLELVTTDLIYAEMREASEGEMTKLRASVVDEATLAGVARSWSVPSVVRLGVGEERNGGRSRDSILSDVVEALLAAVYLDAGYSVVASVIERTWSRIITDRLATPGASDARSHLQETLAKTGRVVEYSFERTGPDHAAVFHATATVDGEVIGTGFGGSKKAAAIDAARKVLTDGV